MPPRPRSHDATSGAGLNAPPARSPAAPRPARPSPPRRARGPRRGHGLRLPPLLCQDGCRGGGGEGRRWCEARAFPMITGPHSLGPCSDCRLVYANRPAIAGVAPTPAASRHTPSASRGVSCHCEMVHACKRRCQGRTEPHSPLLSAVPRLRQAPPSKWSPSCCRRCVRRRPLCHRRDEGAWADAIAAPGHPGCSYCPRPARPSAMRANASLPVKQASRSTRKAPADCPRALDLCRPGRV